MKSRQEVAIIGSWLLTRLLIFVLLHWRTQNGKIYIFQFEVIIQGIYAHTHIYMLFLDIHIAFDALGI